MGSAKNESARYLAGTNIVWKARRHDFDEVFCGMTSMRFFCAAHPSLDEELPGCTSLLLWIS
jgi:hypothetical protein